MKEEKPGASRRVLQSFSGGDETTSLASRAREKLELEVGESFGKLYGFVRILG